MRIIFFFASLLLFLPPAHAISHEEKGLAIAQEADRRASNFMDFSADMVMILRNRAGAENKRAMRTTCKEDIEDADKALIIFDSPGDVRGTALLTHGHRDRDDDQWLYLPALKRVKRISSSNKSGAFMGSEFAFEDLGSREVNKYSYRYLRDENLQGQDCFVIEMYPKDRENSGYSKIISWIEKKNYTSLKQQFYDKRKRLLKELHLKEYHQYLGFHWRSHLLEMDNKQTGKATLLKFSNFMFQIGLSDRDFKKNSLKRMR